MGTLEFKPLLLTAIKSRYITLFIVFLELLFTLFPQISVESSIRNFGGGKRDRTADLLHAMQALSQLSYTPDLHLLS
jgi:hypothetical protein